MKPREALYPELGLNPKQLKLLINEVAAQTGFAPSLIEKDYFCTLVLQHMAAGDDKLVFKGGT